jgi:hypothetical protein
MNELFFHLPKEMGRAGRSLWDSAGGVRAPFYLNLNDAQENEWIRLWWIRERSWAIFKSPSLNYQFRLKTATSALQSEINERAFNQMNSFNQFSFFMFIFLWKNTAKCVQLTRGILRMPSDAKNENIKSFPSRAAKKNALKMILMWEFSARLILLV